MERNFTKIATIKGGVLFFALLAVIISINNEIIGVMSIIIPIVLVLISTGFLIYSENIKFQMKKLEINERKIYVEREKEITEKQRKQDLEYKEIFKNDIILSVQTVCGDILSKLSNLNENLDLLKNETLLASKLISADIKDFINLLEKREESFSNVIKDFTESFEEIPENIDENISELINKVGKSFNKISDESLEIQSSIEKNIIEANKLMIVLRENNIKYSDTLELLNKRMESLMELEKTDIEYLKKFLED